MSEAAPEPGLIQTRAFLPLPRLLTRVSTPGRITPSPRLTPALLQPLSLLRRYRHDQLVTRTADCDRPPASLYSICRGGQPTGVAALLIANPASMPGQPACQTAH